MGDLTFDAVLRVIHGLALASVGIAVLFLLARILFKLVRPDFLRFEQVGLTTRPAVLAGLEVRLASLESRADTELLQLPEDHAERVQFGGREVFFRTTRARLDNGDLQVVVFAGVGEEPGFLSHRLGVAARGFRVNASGVRTRLTEREQEALAMELDARPLYER
jgi:hypothetical protein